MDFAFVVTWQISSSQQTSFVFLLATELKRSLQDHWHTHLYALLTLFGVPREFGRV